MNNFHEWLREKQAFVEALLEKKLPQTSHEISLNEAIRYSVLNGGKRMRSLLVLATAEIIETPLVAIENIICALEFAHAYSLVHDDMPCMDNDDLRRGKLSCHKKFGESTALLVGDSLQSIAFSYLSSPSLQVNPDNANTNKKISLEELKKMHQYKTGALINAACLMTVLVSKSYDKNILNIIDTYSKLIGLMFQIQDDILDKEANQEILGKTPGKDEKDNKSTFVSLLGISKSKELVAEYYEEALTALKPFGDKAYYLAGMAELIMKRSH
jgi:farnesyl diphosphate synthase